MKKHEIEERIKSLEMCNQWWIVKIVIGVLIKRGSYLFLMKYLFFCKPKHLLKEKFWKWQLKKYMV